MAEILSAPFIDPETPKEGYVRAKFAVAERQRRTEAAMAVLERLIGQIETTVGEQKALVARLYLERILESFEAIMAEGQVP